MFCDSRVLVLECPTQDFSAALVMQQLALSLHWISVSRVGGHEMKDGRQPPA